MTASSKPVVSLDRLHEWAAYLEQSIVFGQHGESTQRQMEAELKGNLQRLSRADIWYIAQRLLAGSPYAINQAELEALDALQGPKDLSGVLRSIVLTAHQKTGALTGRIGVHSRIAAETDANAAANTAVVLRLLAGLEPGNRLLVMDAVKSISDEGQLRAPDIFEANIYGQLRNGLLENHAWNLQRLVRAIRDQGYQNRVMLIIRLDGPDAGANVNPFNPSSLQKYRLAIAKLIRYLETTLPLTPFKIVLGNEPDLFQERQWSDPRVDPRTFTLNQFAPAMGAFMKSVARLRPDVTFLCPALSANLKLDHLAYYTVFFGQERPENLVPALHGYAADVATPPSGQRNLIEQQAEALRLLGKFRHLSCTEIGSGNPFDDIDRLSERMYFDDVVAWLLLSREYRTPPGQDNRWNFQISPVGNDPGANHLIGVINRSKNRVLRNVRERSSLDLQLMRNQLVDRPAYWVEYVSHNTPGTLVVGQTRLVSITVRNTSSRIWTAGGPYPVRLGYHWYTPDGRQVNSSLWDDYRTYLPYNLAPGESVVLSCKLSVPRVPGVYELRWDMVEEQRTWFAWQNVPTLNVKVTVDAPSPAKMRASASHNNVSSGADNVAQALDGRLDTRWSSRAVQQPGMWFELDLNQVRPVSGLTLDSSASPQDYPQGYVVRVSTDRQRWEEVARQDRNERGLDVTFSPRPARYIRIEQTGSSDRWWWSIHEIVVKG